MMTQSLEGAQRSERTMNQELRAELYFLVLEIERLGGTYDALRKSWLRCSLGSDEAARIEALRALQEEHDDQT